MRTVLIYFAILSLISCVRPLERRTTVVIEKQVKEALDNPESYEAISTVIDSAFTPKDDANIYTSVAELHKLIGKLEEYKFKAARAERVMKIWKKPYENGFGHINYEKSEEDFGYYTQQIKNYSSEIDNRRSFLRKVTAHRSRFIGYKVTHMYAAKDAFGNNIVGEKIFITDKTMNRILAEYDSNDKEYQTVQRVYRELKNTQ